MRNLVLQSAPQRRMSDKQADGRAQSYDQARTSPGALGGSCSHANAVPAMMDWRKAAHLTGLTCPLSVICSNDATRLLVPNQCHWLVLSVPWVVSALPTDACWMLLLPALACSTLCHRPWCLARMQTRQSLDIRATRYSRTGAGTADHIRCSTNKKKNVDACWPWLLN